MHTGLFQRTVNSLLSQLCVQVYLVELSSFCQKVGVFLRLGSHLATNVQPVVSLAFSKDCICIFRVYIFTFFINGVFRSEERCSKWSYNKQFCLETESTFSSSPFQLCVCNFSKPIHVSYCGNLYCCH